MIGWEITSEDIDTVLKAHGVVLTERQVEDILVQIDHDVIFDGLLYYTDFGDQSQSALSDLEDQLAGLGVIGSDKQFHQPS